MATGVDYSPMVNKEASVVHKETILEPGDTNLVSTGEDGLWGKLSVRELLSLLISKFQPGELWQWSGQFKDPSKRLRIFLISLFIPVLLWILVSVVGGTSNSLLLRLLVSTFLSSLTYLLSLWAIKFETKRETWYTVLLFPALFVFITSLFLQLVFFYEFYRLSQVGLFIILLGVFVVGLYILLLALNIMNVSLFKYIPLVSSSYRAIFAFTLISLALIAFNGLSIAQAGPLYWGGAVAGMAIIMLLVLAIFVRLCLVHWPTIVMISLGLVVTVLTVFLALSFWQISTVVIVLGMAATGYIGLHLVIHHTRQGFSRWFFAEYTLIIMILVLLVLADLYRVW